METAIGVLFGAILVLLLAATAAEVLTAQRRRREALYLVTSVGTKLGLAVREKPLSLRLPDTGEAPTLHYHLLAPGDERDSITLKASRDGPTRLGNVLIDNDPARIFAPGMKRLILGSSRFDRCFRVFTQDERSGIVANLLAGEEDLLLQLEALARHTRTAHLQLDDLSGHLKIQVDDESLRFPSDVEEVTRGLVTVYRRYRRLAGLD